MCVVPVVVCGTLPLLALLIIRHMYTTSIKFMVKVTATSTRITDIYTPCTVAVRVSIATGPVVEEHLAATAGGGNVVVVNVVVNLGKFAAVESSQVADWHTMLVE